MVFFICYYNYIQSLMEKLTPFVIEKNCLLHNKPSTHFCISSNCANPNIFVCSDPICSSLHAVPQNQLLSINRLNQMILRNISSFRAVKDIVRNYFNQLKGAILHQMEKDFVLLQHAFQEKYTHVVFSKLKAQQFTQLKGSHIRDFLDYLQSNSRQDLENAKNYLVNSMQKLETNIKSLKKTNEYIQLTLRDFIGNHNTSFKPKIETLESKILIKQDLQFLTETIQKKKSYFKQWKLVFRASQFDFSAKQYHLKCDGLAPTVVVIKTSKGRRFGAFINTKIASSTNGEWLADATCLSFIFSLDKNQFFPLKNDRKAYSKALYAGLQGPQIGCGCDIYIKDKCHQSQCSGSNLGGSFQLPIGIKFQSAIAQQYLAGEQLFFVDEYQVFHLS